MWLKHAVELADQYNKMEPDEHADEGIEADKMDRDEHPAGVCCLLLIRAKRCYSIKTSLKDVR